MSLLARVLTPGLTPNSTPGSATTAQVGNILPSTEFGVAWSSEAHTKSPNRPSSKRPFGQLPVRRWLRLHAPPPLQCEPSRRCCVRECVLLVNAPVRRRFVRWHRLLLSAPARARVPDFLQLCCKTCGMTQTHALRAAEYRRKPAVWGHAVNRPASVAIVPVGGSRMQMELTKSAAPNDGLISH